MLESQGYAVPRALLGPSISRSEVRNVAARDRACDIVGYGLQVEPAGLQGLEMLDHEASLASRDALCNWPALGTINHAQLRLAPASAPRSCPDEEQ